MSTDRAAKEATRNEIKAVCGHDGDAVRVLVWMNGAKRSHVAIVDMLTEINMDREDLSSDEDGKVAASLGVLDRMVAEGWVTRSMRDLKVYYAPGESFARRNTF